MEENINFTLKTIYDKKQQNETNIIYSNKFQKIPNNESLLKAEEFINKLPKQNTIEHSKLNNNCFCKLCFIHEIANILSNN